VAWREVKDMRSRPEKVLSEMDPDYVGALSLMIVPGTLIEMEIETGKLVLPIRSS